MCKLLCSLWTSFIKVWEQFNFKFFKVYFMEIKRKIESTQLKSEICSLLHSFNWKNWNRILDSTISCWSGNKPSLLSRAVSSRGEAREWPKSSLINYMIVKFCPVFLTIMYMYDWIWFPYFFQFCGQEWSVKQGDQLILRCKEPRLHVQCILMLNYQQHMSLECRVLGVSVSFHW